MKTEIEQTATVIRIETDNLAWQLWEEEGRPLGRDREYWVRAERQLLAAQQQGKAGMIDASAKRRASRARVENSARG